MSRRLLLSALVLFFVGSCTHSTREPAALKLPTLEESRDDWAVDPFNPGSQTPPDGTLSLFDALFREPKSKEYFLPNGFAELKKFIESSQGLGVTTRGTIIPLGRSLQRNASQPHFFEFPRVVLAATGVGPVGEPTETSVIHLALDGTDQIFFGYNEVAAQMEVISYNELAGRFEFQVVRDFGNGKTPTVEYADRNFCLSCHQNQAPLFPRRFSKSPPQWQETSGSDAIFTALEKSAFAKHIKIEDGQKTYFGIPFVTDRSAPYDIDNSTDNANLINVYQRIWGDACTTVECRGRSFQFMLMQKLTRQGESWTERADYKTLVLSELKSKFQRWPNGLWIPNSDLPNRNPLEKIENQCDLTAATEIYQITDPNLLKPLVFANTKSSVLSELDLLDKNSQTSIHPLCNPRNLRAPFTGNKISFVGPTVDETTGQLKADEDQVYLQKHILGLSTLFTEKDVRTLDQVLKEKTANGSFVKKITNPSCTMSKVEEYFSVKCTPKTADSGQVNVLLNIWPEDENEVDIELESLVYTDRPGCQINYLSEPIGADQKKCGSITKVSGRGRRNGAQLLVEFPHPRPRFPQGQALDKIEFGWDEKLKKLTGEVTVYLMEGDLMILESAIDQLMAESHKAEKLQSGLGVFGSRPFSRLYLLGKLYEALGKKVEYPKAYQDLSGQIVIAKNEIKIKEFDLSKIPGANLQIKPFFKYCYACHSEALNGGQPNFLYSAKTGDEYWKEISSKIQKCSERIFARLKGWDGVHKEKSMPPYFFFGIAPQLKTSFDQDRPQILNTISSWLKVKYQTENQSKWAQDEGWCEKALNGQ